MQTIEVNGEYEPHPERCPTCGQELIHTFGDWPKHRTIYMCGGCGQEVIYLHPRAMHILR